MESKVTLREMVNAFIREKKVNCIEYLEELGRKVKALSYDDFIKTALTCYPDHKWHIERFAKEEAYRMAAQHLKLIENNILSSKSFDELLKHINSIKIKGFGDLAKYDAAIAFGSSIRKLPDKIFMHAGPKKAAKFIFDNEYSNKARYLIKPNRIQYIDVNDMPEEFNDLKDTPYLIEDCLCFIYSTYLKD